MLDFKGLALFYIQYSVGRLKKMLVLCYGDLNCWLIVKRILYLSILFLGVGTCSSIYAATKIINYRYSHSTHHLINISNGQSISEANAYYLSGNVRKKTRLVVIGSTRSSYANTFLIDPNAGIIKTQKYGADGGQVNYRYDKQGIASINYFANGGLHNKPAFYVAYSYSPLGQALVIKRDNGYSTFNHFNVLGVVSNIMIGLGSYTSPINKVNYWYHFNPAGNTESIVISSKTLTTLGKQGLGASGTVMYEYHYNPQNKLIGFDIPNANILPINNTALYPRNRAGAKITCQNYWYGLNNNIKNMKSRLYNSGNPSLIKYFYDKQSGHPSRLLKALSPHSQAHFYQYNPRGDLIMGRHGGGYAYNSLNQLISYHSMTDHKPYVNIRYAYNNDGLLTYEQTNLNGSPVLFYYGSSGTLEGLSNEQGKAFYLHGLANFIITHGAEATTEIYAVNQGNIALTTIDDKQIKDQYLYTPYGIQTNLYSNKPSMEITPKSIKINGNNFGYTGQFKDPATGWMMLGGFRNYSPVLSRFMQTDTYNSFSNPAVNNSYAYVKNNPLFATDPSGHMMDAFKDAVGAAQDKVRRAAVSFASMAADGDIEGAIARAAVPEEHRTLLGSQGNGGKPLAVGAPKLAELPPIPEKQQLLREVQEKVHTLLMSNLDLASLDGKFVASVIDHQILTLPFTSLEKRELGSDNFITVRRDLRASDNVSPSKYQKWVLQHLQIMRDTRLSFSDYASFGANISKSQLDKAIAALKGADLYPVESKIPQQKAQVHGETYVGGLHNATTW